MKTPLPRPRSAAPSPTLIWRSQQLPGIELTLGVNAGRRCRLLHESYAICVVPHAGNARTVLTSWKYRGSVHQYRPGDVGIEEPGEVHTSVRVHSPIRYCMLRVAPDVLEGAARELGIRRVHFPEVLAGNSLVYQSFSRLYRALAQPSSRLEQQERLWTFLQYLLGEAGGGPRLTRVAQPSLARVRDYLEAHLADAVCLDDLARLAGLSRFHLSRSFAQAYGLSPHAYQNQLRLRVIRERLRSGFRPDSIDAGFFDQSHMIRHFRDSMGMTPGEFTVAQPTLPPLD